MSCSKFIHQHKYSTISENKGCFLQPFWQKKMKKKCFYGFKNRQNGIVCYLGIIAPHVYKDIKKMKKKYWKWKRKEKIIWIFVDCGEPSFITNISSSECFVFTACIHTNTMELFGKCEIACIVPICQANTIDISMVLHIILDTVSESSERWPLNTQQTRYWVQTGARSMEHM